LKTLPIARLLTQLLLMTYVVCIVTIRLLRLGQAVGDF